MMLQGLMFVLATTLSVVVGFWSIHCARECDHQAMVARLKKRSVEADRWIKYADRWSALATAAFVAAIASGLVYSYVVFWRVP
jgi:hypothetical protein